MPPPRGPSHVPNSSSAISSRVRNLRTLISTKEATPDIHGFLLDDARVRAAFLVTDAEGKASFEGVPCTVAERIHPFLLLSSTGKGLSWVTFLRNSFLILVSLLVASLSSRLVI